MSDGFDPEEGRRLVVQMQDLQLRDWLWRHRAALIQAARELPHVYLQVEERDKRILALLDTLAKTEQRLPGITSSP